MEMLKNVLFVIILTTLTANVYQVNPYLYDTDKAYKEYNELYNNLVDQAHDAGMMYGGQVVGELGAPVLFNPETVDKYFLSLFKTTSGKYQTCVGNHGVSAPVGKPRKTGKDGSKSCGTTFT